MAKVEIIQHKGYNFLWIDDYLWMWDLQMEREIQKRIAKEAFGKVLVVGYGLGLVQGYLRENKKVISILTLEKEYDVIKECERVYMCIHGSIEEIDFYDWFAIMKYDCIIGDTWNEIDPLYLEAYKKFKAKAQLHLKPNGKILAWGQAYFEYLIKKENKDIS